ncbi:hypothetical protein GN958_ATG02377, partial [Phytophthora infestans]
TDTPVDAGVTTTDTAEARTPVSSAQDGDDDTVAGGTAMTISFSLFRPLEPMLSWSELITRGDMSHRMRDRFALKKMVRIVVHSSAPVLVSQTPLRARVLSINSEPGVVQKHLK